MRTRGDSAVHEQGELPEGDARRPSVCARAALDRCRSDRIATVREAAKEALAVLADIEVHASLKWLHRHSSMHGCTAECSLAIIGRVKFNLQVLHDRLANDMVLLHDNMLHYCMCNVSCAVHQLSSLVSASLKRHSINSSNATSCAGGAMQEYERGAGGRGEWPACAAARSAKRAAQRSAQGAPGKALNPIPQAAAGSARRARASPDICRARRDALALDRAATPPQDPAVAVPCGTNAASEDAGHAGAQTLHSSPPAPATVSHRSASEGAGPGQAGEALYSRGAGEADGPGAGRRRRTWELPGRGASGPSGSAAGAHEGSQRGRDERGSDSGCCAEGGGSDGGADSGATDSDGSDARAGGGASADGSHRVRLQP